MSVEHWIILSGVTFVAAVFRGAIGMGFALMVLPFYLWIDPTLVPSTVIMIGLLLSCVTVLRERDALDVKGLKFSVSGRMIGNLIAVLFLSCLTGRLFDWVVAMMILVAVAISLLPFSFQPKPRRLFGAGIASGVMGTISSLDGPPIALLYQHQKGEVIRATLGGYFVIGAVLSLVVLAFAGKVTADSLRYFVLLSPVALLGFNFSKFAIKFLKARSLRYSILAVSTVSAVLILMRPYF